ncbi:MAG: hypothetical protein AAF328_06925 [Planctomycetota bacterium]
MTLRYGLAALAILSFTLVFLPGCSSNTVGGGLPQPTVIDDGPEQTEDDLPQGTVIDDDDDDV